MKRKLYLQPAIETMEAAPAALLAGSLTTEGEMETTGVYDDESPDPIIGLSRGFMSLE